MIEEIKIDRLEELIHEMMIKIRNTSVTNSAEGNPIEIDNAAAAPLVKCVTQITGYQSGSGTPSPDNIRPIVAYTEGKIEVSDEDGNTTTHTTTFPSAIYRGSEDVVNGEVTKEWGKITLNGSESWSFYLSDGSTELNSFRCNPFSETPKEVWSPASANQAICNMFAASGNGVYFHKAQAFAIDNNSTLIICTNKTSVSDFTTWLSNNNVEIAYTLATPTTSSVTPTNLPIKSLSGYNHIESSTGEMEVTYITEDFEPLVPTT